MMSMLLPPHRSARRILRASVVLVALAATSALAAVLLFRVRPGATADTATSEGLLLAAAWWTAAALFVWIALTTFVSWLARVAGAAHAARWVDVATLPVVRRLLDRALAVTLATSAVAPLVAARAAGAAPAIHRERVVATVPHVRRHAVPDVRRHSEPQVRRHAEPQVRRHTPTAFAVARTATTPRPSESPIVRGATTTTTPVPAAPAPRVATPTPASAPRGGDRRASHVVVRDDNLWTIAANALARHGLPHDDAAVARYWWRVIAVNRNRLRSHDPNLIFPGEIVRLPPLDPAG